jgi:hypothetical protein
MLIWERVINSPFLGAQFQSLRSWCLQSWVKKSSISLCDKVSDHHLSGNWWRPGEKRVRTACSTLICQIPCGGKQYSKSKWHVSNHWIIWIWESCQAYDMDDAWASDLGVRNETHGAYMDSVSPLQPSLGPQGAADRRQIPGPCPGSWGFLRPISNRFQHPNWWVE